jgi:molybdopterin molybdotransferase
MTTFQRAHSDERMIPVEEAQQLVLAEIEFLPAERVRLADAFGRVLREDVAARFDVPSADNSGMDGYAVRAIDIAGASGETPAVLRVIEDIPAGRVPLRRVETGTAARIMTGAMIPVGADTVAHVEITDAGETEVRIFQSLPAGTHVRGRGEDMRAGSIALREGTPISAAETGVLASVQKAEVLVGRQPTVAILSTGDEIIEVSDEPMAGKVVNSNSYALASLVREAGAIARILGVVRDTREATIAAIESALTSDFVISSGGVSAGAYDFVKDALDELAAETKFWKVAMKPGKPVVFSRLRDRVYFGLPGNPVSCMVAFVLFVAPSIRKAMGQTSNLLPPVVRMRTSGAISSKGDRRTYIRVRVTARSGELAASPMPSQGSHVSTSMLGANGLAVLEAGITRVDAGKIVDVVLIGAIGSE